MNPKLNIYSVLILVALSQWSSAAAITFDRAPVAAPVSSVYASADTGLGGSDVERFDEDNPVPFNHQVAATSSTPYGGATSNAQLTVNFEGLHLWGTYSASGTADVDHGFPVGSYEYSGAFIIQISIDTDTPVAFTLAATTSASGIANSSVRLYPSSGADIAQYGTNVSGYANSSGSTSGALSRGVYYLKVNSHAQGSTPSTSGYDFDFQVAAVPEPSTVALVALALMGCNCLRWRRSAAKL